MWSATLEEMGSAATTMRIQLEEVASHPVFNGQ